MLNSHKIEIMMYLAKGYLLIRTVFSLLSEVISEQHQ